MAHTNTLTDPRSCAVGVSGAFVFQVVGVAPWPGNRGGQSLPGLHHPPYPPPIKLRTPGGGRPAEEGAACTLFHPVGGGSSKNTPNLRLLGVLRRCNWRGYWPTARFATLQNPQVGRVLPQFGSFLPHVCFLVRYHFLSLFLLFIEREREKERGNGSRKSAAKGRKSENHVTDPIRRLHRHPQVNLRVVQGKKASVFNGLRGCRGSSAGPQREMPPSPPRALFFGGASHGE